MKKYLFLLLLFIVAQVNAQNNPDSIHLQGTVLQETTLMPLNGVSVAYQMFSKMTRTNAKGQFILPMVPFADTLVITHTGYYPQKIPVPITGTVMRVILTPRLQEMDEVVVNTGYEKIRSTAVTGSVGIISNERLSERITTTITERLDGMVSGMLSVAGTGRPLGRTGGIMVRGLSTLSQAYGAQEPLIVLDNFPYEGTLDNINPNDVLTITVLKDAAAASIWGAKAGNGVIVITTKKGQYNRPITISLTSNAQLGFKPDLYYMPRMPSTEFIDLQTQLFNQGYYDANLQNNAINVINPPVAEILHRQRNGTLDPASAQEQINYLRQQDFRKDINRYLHQSSLSRQYALNLSGGNHQMNHYFSAGYDEIEDQYRFNESNRISLKQHTTFRVTPKLELQTGILYVVSRQVRQNQSIPYRWPYAQLKDDAGQALTYPRDYRPAYIDTVGGDRLLDWHYVPLEDMSRAKDNRSQQDLLLNLIAQYRITKGVQIEVQYQHQRVNSQKEILYDPQSYHVRNLVNTYTPPGGSYQESAIPYSAIQERESNLQRLQAIRGQLNLDQQGRQYHIKGLLGAEYRAQDSEQFGRTHYGYDPDVLTYANMDFVRQYPLYNGGWAAVPNNMLAGQLANRFVSLYGNVTYTHKTRYFLTASARRDGSNLFGVKTNNQWKPLWSAGAGWDISAEPFYKFSALPFLKLRMSYGYQGNVNNTIAGVLTLRYSVSPSSSNLPMSFVDNVPNPQLRWEQVGQTNIALDFGSKNKKLTGSIDFYYKNCTDLIAPIPADLTLGVGESITKNIGQIGTRGLDIQLNAILLQGVVQWQTGLLFSYNTTKVKKYYYPPLSYINDGSGLTPIVGREAYLIISYPYAGLSGINGNPQGFVNGAISEDYSQILNPGNLENQVFSGPARPVYFGAMHHQLQVKKLTLSFNITYSLGHYFNRRNGVHYQRLFQGAAEALEAYPDYQKRWQQPGDELYTTIPSMIYPVNAQRDQFYNASTAVVERGDHIRLQYVHLNYSFTKQTYKRLPVREMALSVNASNLGILWRATRQRLDPDTGGAPIPKRIAIGIRIII